MRDEAIQSVHAELCSRASRHDSCVLRIDCERASLWLELMLGQICAAAVPGRLGNDRGAVRRRMLDLLDRAVDCEEVDDLPDRGCALTPALSPHALVRMHLRRMPDAAVHARYDSLLLCELSTSPTTQPPYWLLDGAEARLCDAIVAGDAAHALESRWGGSRADMLRLLALLDACGALLARPAAPRDAEHARRWLGVEAGVSPDALRAAYRAAALRWHPDRHPRASAPLRDRLAARFSAVDGAYRVLLAKLGT